MFKVNQSDPVATHKHTEKRVFVRKYIIKQVQYRYTYIGLNIRKSSFTGLLSYQTPIPEQCSSGIKYASGKVMDLSNLHPQASAENYCLFHHFRHTTMGLIAKLDFLQDFI